MKPVAAPSPPNARKPALTANGGLVDPFMPPPNAEPPRFARYFPGLRQRFETASLEREALRSATPSAERVSSSRSSDRDSNTHPTRWNDDEGNVVDRPSVRPRPARSRFDDETDGDPSSVIPLLEAGVVAETEFSQSRVTSTEIARGGDRQLAESASEFDRAGSDTPRNESVPITNAPPVESEAPNPPARKQFELVPAIPTTTTAENDAAKPKTEPTTDDVTEPKQPMDAAIPEPLDPETKPAAIGDESAASEADSTIVADKAEQPATPTPPEIDTDAAPGPVPDESFPKPEKVGVPIPPRNIDDDVEARPATPDPPPPPRTQSPPAARPRTPLRRLFHDRVSSLPPVAFPPSYYQRATPPHSGEPGAGPGWSDDPPSHPSPTNAAPRRWSWDWRPHLLKRLRSAVETPSAPKLRVPPAPK